MTPEGILRRFAPVVEAEMRVSLTAPTAVLSTLYTMLQYHLGWVDAQGHPHPGRTGKGVRPALCLLTAEAVSGRWEHAVPAAAAIELLHNFSLIHDDIEDQDVERRGRPTVWAVWGEAQAINAGDALFTIARQTLGRLRERGLADAVVLDAFNAFDQACLALTHGQYLDLSFETRDHITVEEYFDMVRGKTAALLSLACRLGAMLSGAAPEVIAAYQRFGEELGVAFQVYDDILGIWGDPGHTGKPVASDILKRKKTLPIVYAMGQGGRDHGGSIAEIYAQEELGAAEVAQVMAILEEAGARAYAQAIAEQHMRGALVALEDTAIRSHAQEELRCLAQFLVRRSY